MRGTLRTTEYNLPFRTPLHTGAGATQTRAGFLLALRDSEGRVGIGEIAPWPQLGTETMTECRARLAVLTRDIAKFELPAEVAAVVTWLSELGISLYGAPLISSALECAALSLIAQRESRSLAALLNPEASRSVIVNGLVQSQEIEVAVREAHRCFGNGINTIKLKVGAGAIEDDINRVHAIRAELPEIAIRVDANGAWTLANACAFCAECADVTLDYIEDPLRHTHPLSLKRLREQFSVNLALDDSARDDIWRETRIRSKVYQTVVVKPALFGLTTRIRRIAQVAGECGAQIVVTSFMESSVGIYYAAQAAAAYGTLGIAHGLETAGLLSDDVLSEPLAAEQGELLLPDCANLAARLKPRYRSELGIDG